MTTLHVPQLSPNRSTIAVRQLSDPPLTFEARGLPASAVLHIDCGATRPTAVPNGAGFASIGLPTDRMEPGLYVATAIALDRNVLGELTLLAGPESVVFQVPRRELTNQELAARGL